MNTSNAKLLSFIPFFVSFVKLPEEMPAMGTGWRPNLRKTRRGVVTSTQFTHQGQM
jgi:hypothetical protein